MGDDDDMKDDVSLKLYLLNLVFFLLDDNNGDDNFDNNDGDDVDDIEDDVPSKV